MAKAAEHHHFPGPNHVLELASELELTPGQIESTQTLFNKMQTDAIALGKQIIEAENQIEALFASAEVTPEQLNPMVLSVGTLRAKLRLVHLNAHLQQRALLSDKQIQLYDALRGNTARSPTGHDHHH